MKKILTKIQEENSNPFDYEFIDIDINGTKEGEDINISDRVQMINPPEKPMLIVGLKTYFYDYFEWNSYLSSPPYYKDPNDFNHRIFHQRTVGNFIEFTDNIKVSNSKYNLFAGFFSS